MDFSDLSPSLVVEPVLALTEAMAQKVITSVFPYSATLSTPAVDQDLLLPLVALSTARESWTFDELKEEYGEPVARLLADWESGETTSDREAYQLLGAAQMLNRGTDKVTIQPDKAYLSWFNEQLEMENDYLHHELQNELIPLLGRIIRFGLYHERSRTFIPLVCERGIITSINETHFNDDRLLVSQALNLLAAYNDRACQLGLPMLSQVGFYNHRVDALLEGPVYSSRIVDASRIGLP